MEISQIIYEIAKAFLLPPGLFCLLLIIGFLRWSKSGKKWVFLSLFLIYFFSLPPIAYFLTKPLQKYPPVSIQQIKQSGAQAILILSSGRRTQAIEYNNQDVPNAFYFERLRYGAWLHKKTKLPIFITGGLEKKKLSEIGRDFLAQNWYIKTQDIENQSTTTWENALLSERMFKRHKINSIVLVSHAWHLPRAMKAFNKTQLNVLPAGTVYLSNYQFIWQDLLPSINALHQNYYALHEWTGRAWYSFKALQITQ